MCPEIKPVYISSRKQPVKILKVQSRDRIYEQEMVQCMNGKEQH